MDKYAFEKKKLKNYLGKSLYEDLKKHNAIIAGGTIASLFTNKEINDIDLYFRSSEELRKFLLNIGNQWVLAQTDKALLFKYDNEIEVQTIYFKYFNDSYEIFDTFDFTVCMGAFDFKTEEFVLNDDFLKHNSQRLLKFNQNTSFPIVSALRVDKYKKKGYSISKSEFIRIMLTILKLEINDYKSLKEQMGGMYGENYDKLLKPQENEEFDIYTIIDKMKDMCVDDSYFKYIKTDFEIDDWERFVYKITGEKFKCFKYNDSYYEVYEDTVEKCDEFNENENALVNIGEVLNFPLTKYKYVKRKNDKLVSHFDGKYEYKVGEYNTCMSSRRGLFAVELDYLNSCMYARESNNVLLELRIDSIDDVFTVENLFKNTCDYKRVFVVREVPKEEEMQIRKSLKDFYRF